jgi:hypothetical protein
VGFLPWANSPRPDGNQNVHCLGFPSGLYYTLARPVCDRTGGFVLFLLAQRLGRFRRLACPIPWAQAVSFAGSGLKPLPEAGPYFPLGLEGILTRFEALECGFS